MLDHEEKFLFKEEILALANSLGEPGQLDNVEDLLTDVITSPRFDSEVFTLERSLQVMLGGRAGTTLVGLLTVAPDVFDEVAEVRIPPEVHERLVAWRARFGLAIDNALNFLNNPDGIQGHNFATQIAHVEERRVLQGRLTLVRYNNEPQFFVADAAVFLGLVADIMDRLGPYLEADAVDADTVSRLRDGITLIERKTTSPRFDSDVFTLERSLQVMLGGRAGSTLVGLLTVDREVFDETGEMGLPSEVHERLVSWRARFGLAIDNALNYLNNPDGIQGHNFGTQLLHAEGGTTLQGRLTLVRYNNEPQFFIADADILLNIAADLMERLGEHIEPEMVDAELVARLNEAVERIARRTASTGGTRES